MQHTAFIRTTHTANNSTPPVPMAIWQLTYARYFSSRRSSYKYSQPADVPLYRVNYYHSGRKLREWRCKYEHHKRSVHLFMSIGEVLYGVCSSTNKCYQRYTDGYQSNECAP